MNAVVYIAFCLSVINCIIIIIIIIITIIITVIIITCIAPLHWFDRRRQ